MRQCYSLHNVDCQSQTYFNKQTYFITTHFFNKQFNRPDRYLRNLMLSRSKTSQRSLRSRVRCVPNYKYGWCNRRNLAESGVQNERCALFWQSETSRELGIPNWSIHLIIMSPPTYVWKLPLLISIMLSQSSGLAKSTSHRDSLVTR